jgi:hypothetical protein
MISGYAIKGVADFLDKRDENILADRKMRLLEKEQEDKKFAGIKSFLDQLPNSYSGSNDTKNNSREKAEILLSLENSLGVDSEIYESLAGGSLQNLKDAQAIITDARKRLLEGGGSFTKEDANEAFSFFRKEVIEKENPITVEQVLERWGYTDDTDTVLEGYGMTVSEAAQRFADIYNQPTTLIGMEGAITPREVNVEEYNRFLNLYKQQATDLLLNEINRVGADPMAVIYQDAVDAIEDGSFANFKNIVPNIAAEFATSIINQYPYLGNNNLILNEFGRGLSFTDDDRGDLAIINAIKSRLLRVGSVWSTAEIDAQTGRVKIINTNTLTEEDIERAMNQ